MRTHVLAIVLASVGCYAARGQNVATSTLLKPWPDDQSTQVNATGEYVPQGEVDDGRGDYDLTIVDVNAAVRLSPTAPLDPRVGLNVTSFRFDSQQDLLPDELTDTSIGAAVTLVKDDRWKVSAAAGLGYAGSTAFGQGDAWYGLGSVVATRMLDAKNRESLSFVVDYNGNRSILPDIPLPGLIYSRQIAPGAQLTLGFPFTSLKWQPDEKLTVDISYGIPDNFTGRAAYEFAPRWSVFAALETRRQAFHVDGLGDDRRLFFRQRQVEVGVAFEPIEHCRVFVAGGYAFGQKFYTGWDMRDADTAYELSDEPYVRAGLSLKF